MAISCAGAADEGGVHAKVPPAALHSMCTEPESRFQTAAKAHTYIPGCRALAQTYHPDKQPDERRKEAAAASFTRLQEAYEVSLLGAFLQ